MYHNIRPGFLRALVVVLHFLVRRKPMLTLAEKGVAYQSHYLDLLQFDQHKPEYLAINPDGTIPAMVHGSRVLTESTPMMEYIDDEFPGPPLKPRDPAAPWRMR